MLTRFLLKFFGVSPSLFFSSVSPETGQELNEPQINILCTGILIEKDVTNSLSNFYLMMFT